MENYDFSTFKALSSSFVLSMQLVNCLVYSDFDWKPWKFYKRPPNLWEDQKKHIEFFDFLGKQLKLENWQGMNTNSNSN